MNHRSFLLSTSLAFFLVAAAFLIPKVVKVTQEAGKLAKKKELAPEGMVFIPGGIFSMGNPMSLYEPVRSQAEEWPVHRVEIKDIWMDETEVTNAQFAKFVEETGYVTLAEKAFDPADYPDAPPGTLDPAAFVFQKPAEKVDPWRVGPMGHMQWWKLVKGANWRHPTGPDSDITGKENHPVVNIAIEDARAYAKWLGKRLPTEAEWEYAARGGKEQLKYVWGSELKVNGKWMANIYQGNFPNQNTADDGFEGTAPVKSFPPNSYGLYDMAGNVWEMVHDYYQRGYYDQLFRKSLDGVVSPEEKMGDFEDDPRLDYAKPVLCPSGPLKGNQIGQRLIRGGSFLCAEGYCSGYRPAARQLSDDISASFHVGFRCVMDITE